MEKSKKKVPISREEAIEALVDKIDNWEIYELLKYVKNIEEERISSLHDNDLAWEYDIHCNMDDDTTKTIILEPTKASRVLYE